MTQHAHALCLYETKLKERNAFIFIRFYFRKPKNYNIGHCNFAVVFRLTKLSQFFLFISFLSCVFLHSAYLSSTNKDLFVNKN